MTARPVTGIALAGVAVLGSWLAITIGAAPSGAVVHRAFDSKCGVFPVASEVPAGAPSLPDERAWNQDVSASPVAADSDRIIDYIDSHGGSMLHPDFGREPKYGIPYAVVGSRTKPVRVRFGAYGADSDGGRYRIPLSAPIEGGARSDGDRHVIGYDRSGCKLYELYNATPKRRSWRADSGAIWDLASPDLRTPGFTSADAAGLPIFPGLARFDEVRAGEIDHALRVTFDVTRDAWVNPASHCASDVSSPDAPPMGLRLRLKASYDTSGFTGQSKVIAAALKRYGLINADNGSNWFFGGAPDEGWKDNDLNQLKEIPGSAFEVVKSEAPVHVC